MASVGSAVNVDALASMVTLYLNCCIESVNKCKVVRKFPNEKPWMNREVRSLLRARNRAFKAKDKVTYRVAHSDFKKRDTCS